MLVHHLTSVDGAIVFDIDPDVVGVTGGGTRIAEDVGVDETAALARAMTYQYAAFEIRRGGAAAGIRPRLIDCHEDAMARYLDEIRPMIDSGRFLPAADIGTTETDFAIGRDRAVPRPIGELQVDGELFGTVATGRGVVAAALAWLGTETLVDRTVAIEGFGERGVAVARAVVRHGGRVVGVSTEFGAVARNTGFTIDDLVAAHERHGGRFVDHLGLDVHLARELHELPVDVLIPAARIGSYTPEVAGKVRAGVIVPAASVPYTEAGLAVLRERGIVALPDFVTTAGAVIGVHSPRGLSADEVLARVVRLIGEHVVGARLAKIDPIIYAATLAETFMSTWIPAEHCPDRPPVAA